MGAVEGGDWAEISFLKYYWLKTFSYIVKKEKS